MRLEVNAFVRKGDILSDADELVQRVDIGKSLAEIGSVAEWGAALEGALARAGLRCVGDLSLRLPLTAESAVERHAVRLERISA